MISLSSPPKEQFFDAHYFCDYIELLALASNADEVSIADIINRLYDDNSAAFDQGGETYPFTIRSKNYISLNNDLTPTQHLYLFLLLCSNLRVIKKGKDKLTSDFEDVSKKAFDKYVKPKSYVDIIFSLIALF